MIGGLTISDFGDSGRDYKASLDRASAIYDSAALHSESLVERKYDGIATSSETVTSYVMSRRRMYLKKERDGYHNRCAVHHCEVPRLINNPFVKACQCGHPSAGDLLGRGAVLLPGPVLTQWTGRRHRRGGQRRRRWCWPCVRGGPISR